MGYDYTQLFCDQKVRDRAHNYLMKRLVYTDDGQLQWVGRWRMNGNRAEPQRMPVTVESRVYMLSPERVFCFLEDINPVTHLFIQ